MKIHKSARAPHQYNVSKASSSRVQMKATDGMPNFLGEIQIAMGLVPTLPS
jgi:hypothetical protein